MAIRATQHKPGLHVVCGKDPPVLDCNLVSNARYEKLQIDLCVGGFMLIHLKCHFETKPTLLSCPFFSFFVFVCPQGEVVEFIDEFLDEDKYPTLESPPKH